MHLGRSVQLGAVLEPEPGLRERRLGRLLGPRRWLTGSRRCSRSPCMSGRSALGCWPCTEPSPGDLAPADLADAVALARVATHLLLELEGDLPPGSLPATWPTSSTTAPACTKPRGWSRRSSMPTSRVALSRLRAYAWSRDRSLDDVADDVVARRLRFDDL